MSFLLDTMKLSPAQATEMYIKLRDTKSARDDAHKESMKKIVDAMDKLEGAILEFLNDSGANSYASDSGTAFKKTQTSATVADKVAFMAFVRETEQWDALDVKANKTFVKDYMDENQEVPPGVKVSSISTVGVQRK
jgi:hypothetical protein